ncbi:MAG: hydrogenase maturation nickel metallochaperone HypA [Proteobacteria bacterium]|nr:hydrogenase maturation nickel metallochaperone HypA [Pseudomonadota bacterium]
MHEMSLAVAMLDQLEEVASRENAKAIVAINLTK